MRKLLYVLLAAGIVATSCGFIVSGRPIDVPKATYPAHVQITQPGNLTGTVKSGDVAVEAVRGKIKSTVTTTSKTSENKLKPRAAQ